MANMILPSARTPTLLRALSEVLPRSKRGCKRPFITSIGPRLRRQVRMRALLEKCLCFRYDYLTGGYVEDPIRLHVEIAKTRCLHGRARAPVPHKRPQA